MCAIAELETREGAGEGRDQIRIGRGGIKPGQDGFERGGIRNAGRIGHPVSLLSVQGLNSGTPRGAKSLVLRVASTSSPTSAVAAKNPSITESPKPLLRASTITSPQRSATVGSIGR